MSIAEEKQALRAAIRARERALDATYKAESADAICRHILAPPAYRRARTILAFAGTVHEIDTSSLLRAIVESGRTLVLPRCAAEHALELCVVRAPEDLAAGRYGILEPKAGCPVLAPDAIDFAVIPCLTFDRAGHRLGQGGGYYDRLLPRLRAATCLICREQLVSPHVPTEAHDRPCTLLLTERGLLTPER